MNNENRSIEEQVEMLANQKCKSIVRKDQRENSEDHLRPLSDIESRSPLPLPEQKDYLKTHMFSFKTPTGQDWLTLRLLMLLSVANDFKNKHGIDVSDEVFNSLSESKNNPDLLLLED